MTLLSCSHHSGVRNELYRVLYLMYIHSTTRGDSSETPTRRAEYCRVVQTRIHHSSPDMQSFHPCICTHSMYSAHSTIGPAHHLSKLRPLFQTCEVNTLRQKKPDKSFSSRTVAVKARNGYLRRLAESITDVGRPPLHPITAPAPPT